jgi:hypothetical protein
MTSLARATARRSRRRRSSPLHNWPSVRSHAGVSREKLLLKSPLHVQELRWEGGTQGGVGGELMSGHGLLTR